MQSTTFATSIAGYRSFARHAVVIAALTWLALVGGCARMPSTGLTALKPRTYAELEQYLVSHQPDVDEFRLRGPFPVTTRDDYALALSPSEHIAADLYLSGAPGKAPLVILMHGYGNSKDDHGYQALHLATWGMHCLSVQLPNRGPWVRNGKTLARIVEFVRQRPEAIDPRVDPSKIVLVGHSFGGYSVTYALAEGAAVAGAVLLDPANVGKALPASFRKIARPVMVIGADERVTVARGREWFYRYLQSGVAEISVRGAAHEDAQFP
ncbi:MAG: alpha/beta fold hydrolase, partial [Methanocella sp.]